MNHEHPILVQAQVIKEEIVKFRRWFHRHPELGFEEFETSKFIENYLRGLGLDVRTGYAKTGISAVLEGALPGNTVLLRADIDGLPVKEAVESDFKSETEGRMHACGHDTHMAMLLGAARLLVDNREKLKGKVKFIFQPAEEYVSGARAIIDEGILQNPAVDVALALHIIPDIESGSIEIKEGIITASMDEFEITILGKGGHGSNPQSTIDPIMTGALLVTAIQTIVSRKISPTQGAAVSICQFIAGSKSNIIPQSAYLSGTIRCFDPAVRKLIFEELERITKGICDTAGAGYNLKINDQVPAVVNDGVLYADFIACTSEILGKDEIRIMSAPRTYSEDFSLFGEKIPSLLFFLGTKNPEKNCIYPLHSQDFRIDEDVLPLGSALFAQYCLNRR